MRNAIALRFNRLYVRCFARFHGLAYEFLDDATYALVYFPHGMRGNSLRNRKERDLSSLPSQLRSYAAGT